jgi:APA family basic amino acid/polyamine antiporter
MLPPAVASIHPRFRTPAKMSAITGIVVAAFTLIIPLDILLSLVNIGTMSAFVAVSLGVMVLRVARPELPRPFRTPLVWVTAPVGIAITGLLAVLGLGPITWIWFGGWLLLGLIFYFAYGFRQPPTEADVPSVPTLS